MQNEWKTKQKENPPGGPTHYHSTCINILFSLFTALISFIFSSHCHHQHTHIFTNNVYLKCQHYLLMSFTQSSFPCINHSTQNCLNMTLRSLTCGNCLWRSWAWAAFPWRELLGLFWAARRSDACWRRSSWWQARAGHGWRCGEARSALRSAGWSVSGPPTPDCWCHSSPAGTELQQQSDHFKLQNNDGTPKAK